MKETDLRRMSRRELIEIIYAMKQRELALTQQLDQAREQLRQRELKLDQAGSIAEAALALSGIFEAAQNAADRYLAAISQGQTPEPLPVSEPEPEPIPEPVLPKLGALDQALEDFLQTPIEPTPQRPLPEKLRQWARGLKEKFTKPKK